MTLILGIETSCDDTSIAITKDFSILGLSTTSSTKKHALYGGIIPEIAAREHLESINPTIDIALKQAGVNLKNIQAIGVTSGPGLIGSLAVGVSFAKSLALGLNIPVYGINHIPAHCLVVLENEVVRKNLGKKPFITLIVSGGHSSLLKIDNGNIKIYGQTIDDAPGEVVDKIGRILGLPYPGGPFVDKLAQQGNKEFIKFPRALNTAKDLIKHPYNFSFSGLKTAVARKVEQECKNANVADGNELTMQIKANICASLCDAIADITAQKSVQLCKDLGVENLIIGGGFSANSQFRTYLENYSTKNEIIVTLAPLKLTADNGAMPAIAAQYAIDNNIPPTISKNCTLKELEILTATSTFSSNKLVLN